MSDTPIPAASADAPVAPVAVAAPAAQPAAPTPAPAPAIPPVAAAPVAAVEAAVTAAVETAVATVEAEAERAVSRFDAIVDAWFTEQLHNSPLSQITHAYNHVFSALDDLKARLAKEI